VKTLFNLLLLLSSFFGYLEWSNQSTFIFQLEYDLFFKIKTSPSTFTHPLILLPFLGQLLLLITLFQKTPNRVLTLVGLSCISLIMLMLLLVGILSVNMRIILGSLPFIGIAIFVLQIHWNRNTKP
jgi:hypothetical protein